MTPTVHPAILRYAAGELTAEKAASELGAGVSVSEVIAMLRRAGLPPPEPPPERMAAELAHAREVLGLPPRPPVRGALTR